MSRAPRRVRDERSTSRLFGDAAPSVVTSATVSASSERRQLSIEPCAIHAGIDEAGLGPMLGPLTIGACAMRLPIGVDDPWLALRDVVSGAVEDDRERLVVADSKLVFTRNSRGERRLETTALAFLAQRGHARDIPADARALLHSFGGALCPQAAIEREFWSRRLDFALPQYVDRAELESRSAILRSALSASGIELLHAAVRVVPVRHLNASFAETDNKSRTHWIETRVLLDDLWQRYASEGLSVVVDRQGGRMRYRAVLEEAFPSADVRVVIESAPLSAYEVESPAAAGTEARRMQLVFREKAESVSFAVALASCLAKYMRETCMRAFNAHFNALDASLAPTAGYVTDGRRWLADAEGAIARAGIERAELVRTR